MNIDRGTANIDLLTTWLCNRIQVHTKYSIEQEIKRGLRTCITCDKFDSATETCKRTDNMRPPARIIAYGCDEYVYLFDEIPF